MYKKSLAVAIIFIFSFVTLAGRLFLISSDPLYKTANIPSQDIPKTTKQTRTIYDKNFSPLSRTDTARHVIGYTINSDGITGLLGSYSHFLNDEISSPNSQGIVTTLDKKIQKIAEKKAYKNLKKGAVIVMDIHTGEIRAFVSVPTYSPDDISAALTNPDKPLINRPLQSYNVGSVFKLVVASAAMMQGIYDYEYECKGYIDVGGQIIHCSKLNGHGLQNMSDALANSCNPYFISLGQKAGGENIRNLAEKMGFGRSSVLANGIYGSAGNLPTEDDLAMPAEVANFSFGQGKLLATPVQIATMTSIIANGGYRVDPSLMLGITLDGSTILDKTDVVNRVQIIPSDITKRIREDIKYANYTKEGSNSMTWWATSGVKTSTAQTGRFDEDGNEVYNGWITGFFPGDEPKYSVTVLAEDGGSGNVSAAPTFREIVEEVAVFANA
jgi:penicillin-binding protein 2